MRSWVTRQEVQPELEVQVVPEIQAAPAERLLQLAARQAEQERLPALPEQVQEQEQVQGRRTRFASKCWTGLTIWHFGPLLADV